MKSESLKYRPEIDGLRTIAVVPVILFHAGLSQFQSGFYGVDVFFVISGYLITSVIAKGLESESGFSILHFYERRARRILPALMLTVIMTLLIAPFVLVPGQIKDVGQSVFATALFLSNYFFYLEIDYFNQFAAKAPLLHTWSLAVEEQFYLLFPLVLIALHKLGFRYNTFIAGVFIASFAAALWTTADNPQLSFYSIHTRAWELAAGAAAALYLRQRGGPVLAKRFGAIVSFAALILLAFSLTLLPSDWGHPGWATLLPVFATVILVVQVREGSLTYSILANRFMVHIGLMSYGLYLYHNPLFSYVDVYFDYLGDNTKEIKLALIPLVYLISLASLLLIERPAMRAKIRQRTVLLSACAGIAIFAGIGLAIHLKNGFQSEIAAFYRSRGMEMLVDVPRERQLIEAHRELIGQKDAPFDCKGQSCRRILVIGDSMSDDSFLALAKFGQDAEYRRVYFDDDCMGSVQSLAEVRAVSRCMNVDISFAGLIDEADEFLVAAKWQESTYDDGYEFAAMLAEELDKPVTVSGSAMFTDLSSFSIKAWRAGYSTRSELERPLYDMQRWDRLRISDKLEKLVQSNRSLGWVDRHAYFCDREKRVCNLFTDDGAPLIWDNAHLSTWAYPSFAAYLENALERTRSKEQREREKEQRERE